MASISVSSRPSASPQLICGARTVTTRMSCRATTMKGGVYLLGGSGPLRAWGRATIGTINFDSKRNFGAAATSNGQTVTRTADGSWKGTLYSGTAGLSYEARMGRFSIRPNATIEYYKLKEDGYSETGGGDAIDLTVQSRDSKESAANALLTLGYDLMRVDPEGDGGWARVRARGRTARAPQQLARQHCGGVQEWHSVHAGSRGAHKRLARWPARSGRQFGRQIHRRSECRAAAG